MKFTPNLTKNELKPAMITLSLTMFLLPNLLAFLPGISGGTVNFLGYLISAAAAVCCLRRFLRRNLIAALDHFFPTVYYAILGYLAHIAMNQLMGVVFYGLIPGFVNLNDQTIQGQFTENLYMMLATTVVLAPFVEECFFRGLLFRGLYDRSPALAWILSVGLFATGHVAGYLGSYSPLGLLISFVTYLPAGILLNVTYRRSGNLISPIITHAIINLMAAITVMR